MSVREEDRNKNCPSRGLGLAAAAVGVGVGAALYYYFSKRPENPAEEGSTSSGWEEEPHVLHDSIHDTSSSSSSYTTISEHSTTDTSVHDSSSDESNVLRSIAGRLWNMYEDDSDSEVSSSDDSNVLESIAGRVWNKYGDYFDSEVTSFNTSIDEINVSSLDQTIESYSDTSMEWDVTNSPQDVPTDDRDIMMENTELSSRLTANRAWHVADVERNKRREQAFREREWTLEECSICFEGMLKEQEVLALACTHRFHQSCIMPWLEQQQTCPNCRKAS